MSLLQRVSRHHNLSSPSYSLPLSIARLQSSPIATTTNSAWNTNANISSSSFSFVSNSSTCGIHHAGYKHTLHDGIKSKISLNLNTLLSMQTRAHQSTSNTLRRLYSTGGGVSSTGTPPTGSALHPSGSSTLAKKVASNILSQIREKNYAVLDNVFSQRRYQKLSAEMKQCLKDCAKDWEQGKEIKGEKRSAFVKNLRARTLPFPTVAQIIYFFTKDITKSLNASEMISHNGLQVKSDLASKGEGILTLYQRGSYYSKHLDCPNPDEDGRRISFVYYVTDADWDLEQDGGALRIYPNKDDPEEYEDIAPMQNRLVAYFSHQLPNEVLQPNKNRLSLCFWLSEMIEKGMEGDSVAQKSDLSQTQHRY